ncbi:MAG: response regulator [Pseudobdellovibrionaceae bacterium]
MAEIRQKDTSNFNGSRFLVVDDIQDNRTLESLFLQKTGAQVEFAINGLEAIDKALRGDFDAVLMDLHMPVLDGITAAAHLRHKGYKKPIIAVTADCQQVVRKLAFETGFDDFISKPLSSFQLLSSLRKFCRQKTKEI